MRQVSKLFFSGVAFVASAPALAQGDAYNNGYEYGRQIGRLVKAYLPNVGITLALVAVGIFCWVAVRRRG